MLSSDQIAVLRDRAAEIADPITAYLLQDIARRIAEAGQLTSTAAYEVWRAQMLGISRRELKKQLQKLLGRSRSEIRTLLTQAAEVGYRFDLERLPTAKAIPFDENKALRQIVETAVKLAQEDFTNLTQTLGFVNPYGKPEVLTDAYRSCTDFAFKQVITGAADYNTAIRQATEKLAEKGVQVIEYDSGRRIGLEAAVRRNIMGGLGLMNEQISQKNHDDLGCDGWEISAHANSAPDHEPIQGRQYPDAAYKALNESLVRRIGTLNCGHIASPIILGVNSPQYTEEELRKFREDNEKGVTYQGKHYTGYEATQQQRKLERSIRFDKKQILVDEATGDKDKLLVDQIHLRRMEEEYRRFSKAAGIRTQQERAQVAGFNYKTAGRASAGAEGYYKYWSKSIGVDKSIKNLADYYNVKYTDSARYELLRRYAKDVEAGWISPLAGFDVYERYYNRIQDEIVGTTTMNGIKITGQSKHFMQRVIGTMRDPKEYVEEHRIIRRSGVEIEAIMDALRNGDIRPIVADGKTGKRSQKFLGEKCEVSVNMDNGTLIQCNPRKEGKRR